MRSLRTVALRYGHGRIECPIPEQATLLECREPVCDLRPETFQAGLDRILPKPLPRGTIALVVADKTRLCGYPLVLPWIIQALKDRGATADRLVFHIAYGTHARQSEAESLAAYGPTYTSHRFIHHHCDPPTAFVDLGRTRRSTPARIRADLLQAGLILTIGAISHHYFAGFGGGRKLLFPGLAERSAIEANHRLLLDTERGGLATGCRAGGLAGNPVAEDLAEIETMLPPYFAIHGLLDSHGAVAGFRFGTTAADFAAACREHEACFRVAAGPFDLVLASAGGAPKDINFIQVHKAIDNGAAFVRDGGTLILLAQCPDRIGSTTLLPALDQGPEVAFARLAKQYQGNGGTALAMMAKTARIHIGLVTSLEAELCARLGVAKIEPEALPHLISEARTMAVLPNASMLMRADTDGQGTTM